MGFYLGLDAMAICCLLVFIVDFMEPCLQQLKSRPGFFLVNFMSEPSTFFHVHIKKPNPFFQGCYKKQMTGTNDEFICNILQSKKVGIPPLR